MFAKVAARRSEKVALIAEIVRATNTTERIVSFAKIGRMLAHSPEACAKEGVKQRQHALARSSWDAAQRPDWLTKAF